MPFALKLQADIGGPDGFEATGGEPSGTHRTVAELDPCPEDVMTVLDGTVQEALEHSIIDLDEKVGDLINWIMARLGLSLPIDGFGESRMIIRKMDSAGSE